MPFSQIISRSFDTVWRNRALWVLGMIFAFFGGGGGGGSGSNFQFTNRISAPDPSGGVSIPDLPAWFTVQNIVIAAVAIFVVALLLGLVWLVFQSMAHAGLIYGADKAIDESPTTWREMWRTGRRGPWRPLFWLKFLVRFVPGLIFGLIGLAIAATVALPILAALIEGDQGALDDVAATFPERFFPFFCLILCLVLFAVVLQWVLSLVGNYAARAIVLEQQPLRVAWSQGWTLFRGRALDSFVMSILLGVLLAIAGFIVAIPLLVLAAMVAVPAVFLLRDLSNIPPAAFVTGGILAALVFGLLAAVLSGPLLAFQETVWTMTYRYLRGRDLPSAPATA